MDCSRHRRAVRVWEETVVIPTYGVGRADRNPMFLEKRVYQGSSGRVYPLPVIESVSDERLDRQYQAVFLENEYLKIMVLPELGGRVQMALDKTNDYHFVYFNRVIKPALVGLTGPWISGGIEFNWPQHHRPSTFSPVEHVIELNDDGSGTVWCSEIDRMYGTKGMHGLTLYPDRAYLEVRVQLYNRTPQEQTFLWWANPAVHVDENHQSMFPPDVHAVMDHGRRDVSDYPIATGTYYKVDYAPGTDISRYRNIPVPTSYMAYRSRYDFVGSYDHGRRAGLLHVADHHVSPGKKQWTWGNGEFGQAWERHLTDEDGPYIELMTGVYTDNQPDFSWLAPYEEKRFTQVFYPYKGVGRVKNATREAAVGIEVDGRSAIVRLYVTAPHERIRIQLTCGKEAVDTRVLGASPDACVEFTVDLPHGIDTDRLGLQAASDDGRMLVEYRPSPEDHEPTVPSPATAIDAPSRLESVEALYLAGLHLEQYRHATREPMEYYQEGLRRDTHDARCNLAVGRLLFRRRCFADAEKHLRLAIDRLTSHNANPYDGESHYYLGLALEQQGRFDEARSAFYKATWNGAWQEAGYFSLARLACRRQQFDLALDLLDRCLERNANNHRALHLKTTLLISLQRHDEAEHLAKQALGKDPFNVGILFELARLTEDEDCFATRMRDDAHNYLELADDYATAGMYFQAIAVLDFYLRQVDGKPSTPMVYYYLAEFHHRLGHAQDSESFLTLAQGCDSYLCFPNRLAEIHVLQQARNRRPDDARAAYYLGNLWYDKRQYDHAIRCWEDAARIDPSLATAWRNLGMAYFNKRHDHKLAWEVYNRAFSLDPSDARVLFELDQLAKRLRHGVEERLERLDGHSALVAQRDDLYLERVTLLNLTGKAEAALKSLLARRFHPWEGGEGKTPAQYVASLLQLGCQAMMRQDFADAVEIFQQALVWPPSIGEGKLAGAHENDVHYFLGLAHRAAGDIARSREHFEKAAKGDFELRAAVFYNDQPPEMVFYQAAALRQLGDRQRADELCRALYDHGMNPPDEEPVIDFFAVSLPDFLVFDEDLAKNQQIHHRYMAGLGCLGMGDVAAARHFFDEIVRLQPHHQGARFQQSVADLVGGQSLSSGS